MARSELCVAETPKRVMDYSSEDWEDEDGSKQQKAPILIGSLEKINSKLCKLEKRLEAFTALNWEDSVSVEESQSSSDSFMDYQSRIAQQKLKEKDEEDMRKFAAFYTLQTTFGTTLSQRVVNVTRGSSTFTGKTEADSVKLKLIELYEYPGFRPWLLTPLPNQVPSSRVLEIVAKASVNLDKKPNYRYQFSRLFFSDPSEALLQDLFWYLYLQHFRPDFWAQRGLFNRAAHNYVKLLFYAKDPRYKDTFFRDYPRLMSQALYAAFCHCFPDSYRFYDENFKDELAYLVYGWMAGLKPSPRCWLEWNMRCLEPPSIQQRQEAMTKSTTKKAMTFNFDYLDSLVVSRPADSTRRPRSSRGMRSQGKCHTPRKQLASITEGPQFRPSRNVSSQIQSTCQSTVSGPRTPGTKISRKVSSLVNAKTQSPVSDSGVPDRKISRTVSSQSLVSTVTNPSQQSISSTLRSQQLTDKSQTPSSSRGSKSSVASKDLTAERTSSTERGASQSKLPAVSKARGDAGDIKGKAAPAKQLKSSEYYRMKSHPADTGPDFYRAAFNVNGRSPLVAHYLKTRDLNADLNTVVRIEHAQIEKLPPLNAPTYQDVIKQSSNKLKSIERRFQDLVTKNQRDTLAWATEHQAMLKDHRRKQTALLANQPEVKRLSELLIKGIGLDDTKQLQADMHTQATDYGDPADLISLHDLRERGSISHPRHACGGLPKIQTKRTPPKTRRKLTIK